MRVGSRFANLDVVKGMPLMLRLRLCYTCVSEMKIIISQRPTRHSLTGIFASATSSSSKIVNDADIFFFGDPEKSMLPKLPVTCCVSS